MAVTPLSFFEEKRVTPVSLSSAHPNPREGLCPGTGHVAVSGLISVAKDMEYLCTDLAYAEEVGSRGHPPDTGTEQTVVESM